MSNNDDWEIFAHDLFDRETPPHLEETGSGLLPGLMALCQHHLVEGIPARE